MKHGDQTKTEQSGTNISLETLAYVEVGLMAFFRMCKGTVTPLRPRLDSHMHCSDSRFNLIQIKRIVAGMYCSQV